MMSRNRFNGFGFIGILIALGYSLSMPLKVSGRQGNSATRYASAKTKEVIKRMIEAHGGLEKWRRVPTISFNCHLKVNFGGNNWISYWEEMTIEQGTRRVYATLPNADGTHGSIAFDGKKAWSAGNLQGIARAPARFTAWRNFYLFNIPWLTQDAGVNLGETGKGKLPMFEGSKEYITVKMGFDPGTGDTPKDYYILYIDPDTYRLKASEHVMTFASMMQGDAKSSPPSIVVWEETVNVNGLIVPAKYTVYWKADNSIAVKDGAISNWSFSKPFDESRLIMPPDGEPDESSPVKM